MNIESMRTRPYRSFKVNGAELPAPARERLLAIRRFQELRAAGCAEQAALKEIGVSRRTTTPRRQPGRGRLPRPPRAANNAIVNDIDIARHRGFRSLPEALDHFSMRREDAFDAVLSSG